MSQRLRVYKQGQGRALYNFVMLEEIKVINVTCEKLIDDHTQEPFLIYKVLYESASNIPPVSALPQPTAQTSRGLIDRGTVYSGRVARFVSQA